MSPPLSATEASAQIVASTARIPASTLPADATRIGTRTPTKTSSDPGPLPGGFGIDPPAQTPRIGATIRQSGASQTRGAAFRAPSVPTRPFIGTESAALNGTASVLARLLRVRLGGLRAAENRPQAQGPERSEDRDRADYDVEGGHGDVLADTEGEQRRARGLPTQHVDEQPLLRARA